MSKKKETSSKKTKPHSYGPNKVTYEHFKEAVDIAKKCRPEQLGKLHPKVGAVIVKNGRVIASAHRGSAGRAEHAEYIALEKKAGGNPDVQGADLITTLEPCTVRSHDKKPCVSWIKSRNIRKVWIATLDPNPIIAGYGELQLQEDGIKIGRFPDELADEVLEDNKDFFEWIRTKRPTITKDEQKTERSLVIDTLKEILNQEKQARTLVMDKILGPIKRPKREEKDLDEIFDFFSGKIKSVNKALAQALAVQIDDVGSWIQLGSITKDLKLYGVSVLAYRVSTEIDATSKWAWNGLVESELELSRRDTYWPFQYIMEGIDNSPSKIRSGTWLRQAKYENPDMKVRIAARALQLGQKLDDIWPLVEEAAKESKNTGENKKQSRRELIEYKEQQLKEATAWGYMGFLLRDLGEKESFCLELSGEQIFTSEDHKN